MQIARIPLLQDTALKLTDTIQFAVERMDDFQVDILPVIDDNNYIGYITQNDLLNALDDQFSIAIIQVRTEPIYLQTDQHPYDAMRIMTAYKLSTLPILDENKKYQGMLSSFNLINAMVSIQSQNENGAIMVLEVGTHDFSLSKIAHLVETENYQIINCSTRAIPENSTIEITLKVNKSNIASLLSSFARQNYNVIETFNATQEEDDLHERYQHLMNYINI